MLAGVLGAAVGIGVLALAQAQVVPKLAQTLAFVWFHVDALTLCLELLAVGAAVGIIAAWLSVGRYLRTVSSPHEPGDHPARRERPAAAANLARKLRGRPC